ncbi:MAG TPA: hydroxyacylglutathione hydrolase [Chondromyces sp.]|nr:hydroxyacylglutathione hydrolase [Chondromyces sp.]
MLTIDAIPAFSDNYIWMIGAPGRSGVAVVDPGDAAPVLEVLESSGSHLAAILLTHHHGDHTGGVRELVERHPVPVFGPELEAISDVDNPVRGDQVVALADLDLYLRVVDVPGHTAGHVAYVGPDFALVGDTIFAGGCGRVFEGTMEQMHASLTRLAALPPETAIYCAHEYTVANLCFAREVEPGNRALEQRLDDAVAARTAGDVTVPSQLADELATNPFLRCDQPPVAAAAEGRAGRRLTSEAEVFAVIRQWKDGWRV